MGGYFTAAAGGTVYTGDAFPKEYVGNVFTGDVNGNLVHRDILTPDGVTFSAHRAKDGVEFLASTDVWFRPCNFANAPDGLLYLTDIYREFIETPESIPDAIKKYMDFWSGVEKGRIYRIVPNHPLRRGDLKPNLGKASSAELVAQLANPNGWHRQTAQRLLLERQDKSVAPLLEQMARTHENPLARVQALWMLEGIGALRPELIIQALKDPDAHVREHALRIADEFAPHSKPLANAMLAMAKDSDTRVQFQLALSLGELHEARTLPVLAGIARAHAGDHWMRTAVLSSVNDSAAEFLPLVAKDGEPELLRQVGALIGARHEPAELARFFRTPMPDKVWPAALGGLAHGLKLGDARRLRVPAAEPALAKSLANPSPELQQAAWETARFFDLPVLLRQASADALAPSLPLPKRETAARALRGGTFAEVSPVLRKLLDSHPPGELQAAAIDALSAFDDPSVGPVLLSEWKGLGPEARGAAISALLNRRDRVPLLLKAVESGQVEPAALDIGARARLISNPDPAIAKRAGTLFHSDPNGRAKVVAAYEEVVKLNGDPAHGKVLFSENCAKCHMQRRQGGRVGPDLSGINNKTKEELLTSILNPSLAIEPRFVNYIITTRDGRMFDGVISNETPGAVTLRGGSDEGDETVLRKNIAEIRASSVSLMPEGLEENLGKQDIADVIAYLRGGL